MVTQKLEIYKCNVCGNTVQVLLSGEGELVCCNQPMELMKPKCETGNELAEKHTPEIKDMDGKKYVVLEKHPMLPEHYIQFIEVISKDKSEIHLKYFLPNTKPEMDISYLDKNIEAYELCNIHGLWRK